MKREDSQPSAMKALHVKRCAPKRKQGKPLDPMLARCGYRCDLCPAFKRNLHRPADRQRVSDGWFKYYGFRIPPEQICCDGCLDEHPEARRIDTKCPIRPCALARRVETCGQCPRCGCKRFETRTVTKAWVEKRLGAPVSPADYRRFVLPYERREIQRGEPGKKAQ